MWYESVPFFVWWVKDVTWKSSCSTWKKYIDDLVGGIPTPLKNMSSSVGIVIPNIWKGTTHVPNQKTVMSQKSPHKIILYHQDWEYLYIYIYYNINIRWNPEVMFVGLDSPHELACYVTHNQPNTDPSYVRQLGDFVYGGLIPVTSQWSHRNSSRSLSMICQFDFHCATSTVGEVSIFDGENIKYSRLIGDSMYVCMYACMYVCMHACMYACTHVCMYVCMYV